MFRTRRQQLLPLVLISLSACGPAATSAPKAPTSPGGGLPLSARVAEFAPAKLTAATTRLPVSEQKALEKIIAAARLIGPVFLRQAYAENPALRDAFSKDSSKEGAEKLAFFDIMYGPWDRQREFAPFAVATPRPKGAGFYPADLTADEYNAWLKAHPSDKAAFESLTTVVQREKGKLVAVPYGTAYAEWLKPASALLIEAANLTTNKSLQAFLKSRAAAFLSDDYYPSDKDWMDLDSDVELTIGPYETYEDDLLGQKGAFEAFVTVSDPVASEKLSKYKSLLPAMEANLPIPDAVKTKRGSESPIRVVDLVYTSGDARKSVQTIAFNLPNDERVRAEKGAKKVLLRNLIETKFDSIMRPLATQIMDASQVPYLSSEAFFDETLFHELSHSLGPAFTQVNGQKVEVRVAFGPIFSTIEEAKADVMGAYNILFMVKKGEMPADFGNKLLVSYFAGLFRSVRFGVAEAHGQGAALQINRYIEEGGATFDGAKFRVDFPKLEASITKLVHDLCMLQHDGDRKGADALLAKYGTMSEPIAKAFVHAGTIPVDIRPIYPMAGE